MNTKARRVIGYILVALVILLLLAIAVPNFIGARFVFHNAFTIKVHVTDAATGQPMNGAEVWVTWNDADAANAPTWKGQMTDTNGMCEALYLFEVTGTFGKPCRVPISNARLLQVKADGFKLWTKPLQTLFGKSRDYWNTNEWLLSCEVALEKGTPVGESRTNAVSVVTQ